MSQDGGDRAEDLALGVGQDQVLPVQRLSQALGQRVQGTTAGGARRCQQVVAGERGGLGNLLGAEREALGDHRDVAPRHRRLPQHATLGDRQRRHDDHARGDVRQQRRALGRDVHERHACGACDFRAALRCELIEIAEHEQATGQQTTHARPRERVLAACVRRGEHDQRPPDAVGKHLLGITTDDGEHDRVVCRQRRGELVAHRLTRGVERGQLDVADPRRGDVGDPRSKQVRRQQLVDSQGAVGDRQRPWIGQHTHRPARAQRRVD